MLIIHYYFQQAGSIKSKVFKLSILILWLTLFISK
eukprot:UN06720